MSDRQAGVVSRLFYTPKTEVGRVVNIIEVACIFWMLFAALMLVISLV